MKKRILIFGASGSGKMLLSTLSDKDVEVVGFLDNDKTKWGEKIDGIEVVGNADVIHRFGEIDEIIIASINGMETIKEELLTVGVPIYKINTSFMEVMIQARIYFVKCFAQINADKIRNYSIAEAGVFQGDFAKELNHIFGKNKLYLFDSFEGFDLRDIEKEFKNNFSDASMGHLSMTSMEMVWNKMENKENVIFKKGYFPETTVGLEEERFIFVNLDFDLYNPTLAGLQFFFPRVISGG